MPTPSAQDNNAVTIQAGETSRSESRIAEAHFDAALAET